tara:strand:- start:151 stop:1077 length:927 start_codon:yes stop_codon:yes gene_type:complete
MNVLLYYFYSKVENTEEYYNYHKNFCENLDLRGRIIISKEGLNGTVSGPEEDCINYMKFVKSDIRFNKIDFKIDQCKEHLFEKLSIKIKPYLIKLGVDIDPNEDTGTHLCPKDFYNMMKEDDSIVLDVRSNYEHYIGKFKNSITLDLKKFYDFPEKIKEHELFLNKKYRDKKILTCCTGGIKCETASAYLKKIGFKNVYQLHGGIIKYGIENNGKDFDGRCYVFDGRITKDVNTINPTIITKCHICKITCNIMVNCMNSLCDKHFTMCQDCFKNMNGCCSLDCITSEKIRKKIPDYFKGINSNKNISV